APRHDALTVGRESDASDAQGVSLEDAYFLAGLQVPEAQHDRAHTAAGHELLAVGGQRECRDPSRETQRSQLLSIVQVPESNRAVQAGRENLFSVGGEGKPAHGIGVALEATKLLEAVRGPQPDRVVLAAFKAVHLLLVGAPSSGQDAVAVGR